MGKVTFQGSLPAPKEVDLDGNGRKDVLPTFDRRPNINNSPISHFTFKDPGGLRMSRGGLIPFEPVPSMVRSDRYGQVYQIQCTSARARFHNPYDSRSFAIGQRVAELNPQDGTIGPPKVIAGFTVDLKPSNPNLYRHHALEPAMDHTGYVLSQAFALEQKKAVPIAAVPNLVWVIGKGERVYPEWVLNPPKHITPSPAEQLLKPLYETVAKLPKNPPRERGDSKAQIELAVSTWQKEAARQDPQRVSDLTQEPLRTAIVLSLFQVAGHKPADFED